MWRRFVETYRRIAKTLDVTIREIHLDGEEESLVI